MPKEENEAIRRAVEAYVQAMSGFHYSQDTLSLEELTLVGEEIDRVVTESAEHLKAVLMAVPVERFAEVWLNLINGLIHTYGDVSNPEGRQRLRNLLQFHIADDFDESLDYQDPPPDDR